MEERDPLFQCQLEEDRVVVEECRLVKGVISRYQEEEDKVET